MTRRLLLLGGSSAAAILAKTNPVIEEARKKSKAGKHEEAVAQLEAELKKNPKDAAVKTALGEVYTAYGEAQMFDEKMPPFRKYPAALRTFRKAVGYDPNNKEARQQIATIEGIYKSMGREIPK